MAYMQCQRPVEQYQDPCYPPTQQSNGIFHSGAAASSINPFHHQQAKPQYQQYPNNTHSYTNPQTHSSAAGYNNAFSVHNPKPTHGHGYGTTTPYQTHSASSNGYNNGYDCTRTDGMGYNKHAHGGSHMSGAMGSFKTDKKYREKKYSSTGMKIKKNKKNNSGNCSGSDSSSGSDSD